jgi:hypothetical protein
MFWGRAGLFIGKSNSVNGNIRLLGSDMVWPKVIQLSGAYCIFFYDTGAFDFIICGDGQRTKSSTCIGDGGGRIVVRLG